MVNYEVEMKFSNSLYSSITRLFFDNLVTNINDAFTKQCVKNYDNQMDDFLQGEFQADMTLRDHIDRGTESFILNKVKNLKPKEKDAFNLFKEKENSDFNWRIDPR